MYFGGDYFDAASTMTEVFQVFHALLVWVVVTLTPGVPVENHYFCHGYGDEMLCRHIPRVCVFDDPRAPVLCPRTVRLDFTVTESGEVKTFYDCTTPAYTLTWPGMNKTEQQSWFCIELNEMHGPWMPPWENL